MINTKAFFRLFSGPKKVLLRLDVMTNKRYIYRFISLQSSGKNNKPPSLALG